MITKTTELLCYVTVYIQFTIYHTHEGLVHTVRGKEEEEKGQYLTVRFGYGVSGNYDMR